MTPTSDGRAVTGEAEPPDFLVLALDASEGLTTSSARQPPEGVTTRIWRPRGFSALPPGQFQPSLPVWWAMHRFGAFSNRDYAAAILTLNEHVIHRSFAFPRYVSFPFMAAGDLQIGSVATVPEYQGRGLAAHAIRELIGGLGGGRRRYWYITRANNIASVRTAEAVGFAVVGRASRIVHFGVPFWSLNP